MHERDGIGGSAGHGTYRVESRGHEADADMGEVVTWTCRLFTLPQRT